MTGILNTLLCRGADAATTYRYLRLTMTAGASGDYYELAEVQWMVSSTAYPTSSMTSNSAPSPLVASASSTQSTYSAYLAFNGVVAARGWISNNANPSTEWIKIDLGSGNGIAPTSIKIAPYATGGYNRYPTAFSCEGSNDNTTFTTLYSTSGVTTGWSNQTFREFTF